MKWSHAKILIKNADILLQSGSLPYHKIIQHHTSSVFSHGALFCWLTEVGLAAVKESHPGKCTDRGIMGLNVVESMEPIGVQLTPFEDYLYSPGEPYWYSLDSERYDDKRQMIVDFALSRLGKPYPLWQLEWSFGWLASAVRERLGLPTEVDDDADFCFELCTRAYYNAGIFPPFRQESRPELTTGAMIALWPYLRCNGIVEKD